MNRKSKIKHLKRSDINSIKWDRCINLSFNGMAYGYSWYLDIVCEQWEGLILNDYEAIMPLPCSKKWGISHIQQALFCHQLGIFSCKLLDGELTQEFANAIPHKYKYAHCPQNIFVPKHESKNSTQLTGHTFLLDLIVPYNRTLKAYTQRAKESLKKALQLKTTIVTGMNIREVIDFYKEHAKLRANQMNDYAFEIMRRIANLTIQHRVGELYAAFSAENQLLAIAFFVQTNNRAMMIFSAQSPYGEETFAMYLLLNYVTSKYSEKNITLFFDQVDDPSSEDLALDFGAKKVSYPIWQYTKLPWPAKFFR